MAKENKLVPPVTGKEISKKEASVISAILKVCSYRGISGIDQLNMAKIGRNCNAVTMEYEETRNAIINGNKPEGYDNALTVLQGIESEQNRDEAWQLKHGDAVKVFKPLYDALDRSVKDTIDTLDKELVVINFPPVSEEAICKFLEINPLANGEVTQILTKYLLG